MVQMLDSWTLMTQSVKCFLGLQHIGFQHLWGFFKSQCPTPPPPQKQCLTHVSQSFPKFKNSCGFNIIKVGRGKNCRAFSNIEQYFVGTPKNYRLLQNNIASLIQRLLSNFVTYHWFHHEMTCEKKTQKFHTDAKWLPRSWLCFWLTEANFTHCTTNQKHHPDG